MTYFATLSNKLADNLSKHSINVTFTSENKLSKLLTNLKDVRGKK